RRRLLARPARRLEPRALGLGAAAVVEKQRLDQERGVQDQDPVRRQRVVGHAHRDLGARRQQPRGLGEGIVRDRGGDPMPPEVERGRAVDRKSTRLNSSHVKISYAVFCLKKKKKKKKKRQQKQNVNRK